MERFIPPMWLLFAWAGSTMVFSLGVLVLSIAGYRNSAVATGLQIIGFLLGFIAVVGYCFSAIVTVAFALRLALFFSTPSLLWGFGTPWVAIPALGAGMFLYWLKEKHQAIYGGIEVVGAVLAITVVSFTATVQPLPRLVTLLTSIYFLVRGLTNAREAGLHKKLPSVFKRPIVRRSVPLSFAAVFALLIFFPALLPQWDDPETPFMTVEGNMAFYVSPERCGEPFVICDSRAWNEHYRLLRASPAERKAADDAADKRTVEKERQKQARAIDLARFLGLDRLSAFTPPPPPETEAEKRVGHPH